MLAENVFFGRLPQARGGRVQWTELYARTEELLRRVGLDVAARTRVGHLGIAARQLVEIVRALSLQARVIVMDEPTSALSPVEIDRLFALIGQLREQGVGIAYVSHKLDEILRLSDRVTVLRDGAVVGTQPTADLDEQRLIAMMVGREMAAGVARAGADVGEVILAVKGLTTDRVRDVSFQVRTGEIVGKLAIRTPSADQVISRLSGGNQQKVLIARWLLKENLRVLFVDEPTRGIDVGAKAEIYRLLGDLASQGLAVVVMSSEMAEILGLCDRIYVMSGGRITGAFERDEATQEKLLESALPREAGEARLI